MPQVAPDHADRHRWHVARALVGDQPAQLGIAAGNGCRFGQLRCGSPWLIASYGHESLRVRVTTGCRTKLSRGAAASGPSPSLSEMPASETRAAAATTPRSRAARASVAARRVLRWGATSAMRSTRSMSCRIWRTKSPPAGVWSPPPSPCHRSVYATPPAHAWATAKNDASGAREATTLCCRSARWICDARSKMRPARWRVSPSG